MCWYGGSWNRNLESLLNKIFDKKLGEIYWSHIVPHLVVSGLNWILWNELAKTNSRF
jgi:hypothetical protein